MILSSTPTDKPTLGLPPEDEHFRISMSYAGGVSRGFQLAGAFDRLGYLDTFFWPFYSWKHPLVARLLRLREDKQTIDKNRVRTSLEFILLRKLINAARGWPGGVPKDQFLFDELLDRSVARRLKAGADFFTAESRIGLHSIRKAKSLGMRAGVDRTNSHVEYQNEILVEEYAGRGQEYRVDPRIVEKARREYEESDYIFVLSSFVKRTFLERGVLADKLLLVPSGIDLSDFGWIKKEDDVFRVIFCGAACFKKGTQYLLEAFKSLKIKNAELLLVGGVTEEIKPLLNRYGQWKAVGFVPQRELYKYYCQGSVFVLPSLEEGLAKVIMEAMACGLPVIATTNTGGEDVVREGVDGFIVPIRDEASLKEKMLYLYENPDVAREMGQNARTRIEEHFTLEHYLARLIGAYDKMKATPTYLGR